MLGARPEHDATQPAAPTATSSSSSSSASSSAAAVAVATASSVSGGNSRPGASSGKAWQQSTRVVLPSPAEAAALLKECDERIHEDVNMVLDSELSDRAFSLFLKYFIPPVGSGIYVPSGRSREVDDPVAEILRSFFPEAGAKPRPVATAQFKPGSSAQSNTSSAHPATAASESGSVMGAGAKPRPAPTAQFKVSPFDGGIFRARQAAAAAGVTNVLGLSFPRPELKNHTGLSRPVSRSPVEPKATSQSSARRRHELELEELEAAMLEPETAADIWSTVRACIVRALTLVDHLDPDIDQFRFFLVTHTHTHSHIPPSTFIALLV
jgi:hypothetical protein